MLTRMVQANTEKNAHQNEKSEKYLDEKKKKENGAAVIKLSHEYWPMYFMDKLCISCYFDNKDISLRLLY